MEYLNEIHKYIYETPICNAIRNRNIEIVKLLLTNDKFDINKPYVFINIIIKI